MKLKNKISGEIKEFALFNGNELQGGATLGSLTKEWEDAPEEPRLAYYIDSQGDICLFGDTKANDWSKEKSIGNYFSTTKEAEQAAKKLQAFKRLKDKGFRFTGWEDLQAEMSTKDLMLFNRDIIDANNIIGFRMDDYHDCIKDLNICFGG